jgi:hypothetical protein
MIAGKHVGIYSRIIDELGFHLFSEEVHNCNYAALVPIASTAPKYLGYTNFIDNLLVSIDTFIVNSPR